MLENILMLSFAVFLSSLASFFSRSRDIYLSEWAIRISNHRTIDVNAIVRLVFVCVSIFISSHSMSLERNKNSAFRNK